MVALTFSGAAPRHLPRIQGSSAMAAVPKDNSETGALLLSCHHTGGPGRAAHHEGILPQAVAGE